METILIFLYEILYVISFPPFSIFFALPLSLYLLFFLVFEKRTGDLKIFVALWISQIALLYWITYAIAEYGDVSLFVALIPMILLTAYLSLYPFIFFKIAEKFRQSKIFPLLSASLWIILDYVRSRFLSGFPWEITGYAVYPFRPLMNLGDAGGILLIEFLLIFFISSFFSRSGKSMWIKISSLLLILGILYGETDQLVWERILSKSSNKLRVGIAQGSIDQSVKWSPSYRKKTVKIYEDLTDDLSKKGARVVVWPETATPFYFQSSEYSSRIKYISLKNRIYLLFGSPAYRYENGRIRYLNRAYMVSPVGEIVDYYDKVHLVPFGEYLPLEKYLKFIEKLIPMVGNMSPGNEIKPLKTAYGKFGVLICYESIFPEISREMIRKGAAYLVNITNDAWFGKTSAPYQHFSMASFRAVEFKRFLVRSANTGVSGIVSPTGAVLKETEIFKRTGVTGDIVPVRYRTLYSIAGDWIVILSLILILFYMVGVFVKWER